ncbi:SAG family member [Eimeria mitis]|uniref:SAG family member n=1 Tax=Eimeria mitis TaxID=44415 RepID=U6K5E2_9EIME|nr:SAG family member [Eimeria mitis]CDJ32985.1 SAG family member [Eimeria mitis]
MGVINFLSLAAAAVLLVKANGEDESAAKNTAVRVDCSSPMNAARSAAGFSALEVAADASGQLPIHSSSDSSEKQPNDDYLTKVCDAMKKGKLPDPPVEIKPDGTFAYAVQEGTDADCEAAVAYWKEAFTNFEGLPPANSTDASVYTSAHNVSFISLFNPKESPKVDCAYFTCPAKSTPKETGDNTTEKELKALLCVTTPKALTDEAAPYSQEQWDRITTAINSGNAGVPTFFAVAAAALAALFL